jgi:hypothetical protein
MSAELGSPRLLTWHATLVSSSLLILILNNSRRQLGVTIGASVPIRRREPGEPSTSPASLIVCAAIGAIAFLATGCAEREPALYPLKGKVLLNGQAIPSAELVFHPQFEGPGWMPVAEAQEDGTFEASTKLPGDGVLAGKYKVTVVWNPNSTDDASSESLLPARYAQSDTTDLVVEAGPANADTVLNLTR